ncbi:MAG: hypothetical protein R6X18_17725 [Chloroflexota bacterium]
MNRKPFLLVFALLTMFLLVMGGVAYAEPAAPAADTAEFVEVEPNNTPAQAQSIVYGNYGYPTLSPISDVDYFKFNGAAGDIVYFGNADGCYYYGDSVKITLLDSNQTVLATASLTYRQIALVTLPANGVYYLHVEDATGDPDLDTIRYSLYLLKRTGSEPDDTMATARPIAYGDEINGELYPADFDRDWFRFQGRAGEMVHIEVPYGYLRDPVLSLYNDKGKVLVRDGEFGARGTWINYLLPSDGTYYLELTNDRVDCYGYHSLPYLLVLTRSHSLYVSAAVDGLGGNANIKAADIVTRHPATGKWVLVFDASDVGITKNINAFEWTSADRLLISLQGGQNVPGLGRVKPWDIIRFTPTSLGATTKGTFSFYMKGADVGLSTTGEKIDAIAWERTYPESGSRLLISTNGAGAVPKTGGGTLKFQREDVIALEQTTTGQPVKGTWSPYMDGTAISGLKDSNVNTFTTAPQYMSILDNYYGWYGASHLGSVNVAVTIDGTKAAGRDVLQFIGNSSSWWIPEDTGDWWVYMQAPKLTDKVIDALSLGPPWPLMK